MTGPTSFVASPGGHIDEAYEIANRFASQGERFWITARTPQTVALLAGESVEWVPEVRSREGLRAARTLGRARRIMQERAPAHVISTGSALAVPYILAARWARIDVTYVESATRLHAPSTTGRIVQMVPGVRLHHQGQWDNRRWGRFGSIFDGFLAEYMQERPVRRVLVTIGSEKFPFPRALTAVREATQDFDVEWQTGTTPINGLGLHGTARAWWRGDELAAAAAGADVVVTHAGVGSILMVLRTGKVPVVIPRRTESGEHVDGHQIELADALEGRRLVVVARPGDDITDCIRRAAALTVRRTGASEGDNP